MTNVKLPTEWTAAKYTNKKWGVGVPGGQADMFIVCREGDCNREYNRSLARLMVMAPQLLAACEAVLLGGCNKETLDIVKETVRVAKGETNND